MTPQLLPFTEFYSFYGFFSLFVVGMLLLDLGVFHRNAHEVTVKESLVWTIVWILLAVGFGIALKPMSQYLMQTHPYFQSIPQLDMESLSQQLSLEFFTGFVIEKALAIDNIFVFVIVFRFFAVPPKYQHRVLFYGIIGALIFRAIFIALGSALLAIHWVTIAAGLFLMATGVKLLFSPEQNMDPGNNPLVRFAQKYWPLSPSMEGGKFLTKVDGKLALTPLMLALVFIEFTDIVFAIDSVPAIFSITKEPFIVFTSNVFAILGLRSLYFLLADFIDRFKYLKYGLGLILVFVGLKMVWLNNLFGGKFPTSWSLAIILGIIVLSILPSFWIKTSTPERGA
jgi:tellurite resistance protein TerC